MASNSRPAKLGFDRRRRLTLSREFSRVRAEGKAFRGELLTLGVLATGTEVAARAGFVTSKRVGGAVVRNRVRRRLREIFRLHQHQLARGAWIVTIARPRAADGSYAEIEREWLRLAGRAAILTDELRPASEKT